MRLQVALVLFFVTLVSFGWGQGTEFQRRLAQINRKLGIRCVNLRDVNRNIEQFLERTAMHEAPSIDYERESRFANYGPTYEQIQSQDKAGESNYVRRCAHPGHVALTFDDGPSHLTRSFLDVLGEMHAPATFFVLGVQIDSEEKKSMLRRMDREGHTIASHSWDHRSFNTLSREEIVEEMRSTEEAVFDATGTLSLTSLL